MVDLDVVRVRRPEPPARLFGVLLFLMELLVLAKLVIFVLGGGLIPAIVGGLGIAGSAGIFRLAIPLILVRWETVVDRRSRTVTSKARLIRTLGESHYPFTDFEAVELRLLGGGPQDPNGVFAVVLVGPNVALDVDVPGPVPTAQLFHFLARLSAAFDRLGRWSLAVSLAEFTGLKFRDTTGRHHRSTSGPRRPPSEVRLLDSGNPVLKIVRVPLGARAAALVLLIAGTLFMALMAHSAWTEPLGGGLGAARSVVDLLIMSVIPLAGALMLAYRSGVEIDFPSRSVRRRGSFLGSHWDETYSLDRFDAVFVREARIPFQKSAYRSVGLSGGPYEFVLYDDRSTPRELRTRGGKLSRADRCLASAETLSALCGLPMRVVKADDPAPTAVHDSASPHSRDVDA